MKKIAYLLILFISISFTSCQFTEEITLNKNGSGQYKLNMDMSAMMGAMSEMGENDSIKKEKEKIDSTFYFKDIIEQNKDSIAQLSKDQQEALEALKDLKMHIHLDEEKGEMLYDFILDFKNLSELDNIKSKVEKAQKLQDNKGDSEESIENHDIFYSYTKKHFTRKVVMKDLTAEEQESYNAKMEESKMFLGGSMYKLIYHFPKKIKNVNYKDAQFSSDHKTMTIEVAMDSLTKNPMLLDLKVDF
ncbi:MAG TPA: hypothetical protein EYG92_10165 [Lutibacter sp.]|nr:hypothetical protein [Lutibacter sp.]